MAELRRYVRAAVASGSCWDYVTANKRPNGKNKKYQGRDMDEKAEPSVWYVASIAICIFTAALLLSGVFGGGETAVAIAAQ
ncbi:MAG: hypothetical protein QNJ29_07190 [Rhizobiaceae bacterium]|nr:hypothetical protein [Rhizobiaceae bacterium]